MFTDLLFTHQRKLRNYFGLEAERQGTLVSARLWLNWQARAGCPTRTHFTPECLVRCVLYSACPPAGLHYTCSSSRYNLMILILLKIKGVMIHTTYILTLKAEYALSSGCGTFIAVAAFTRFSTFNGFGSSTFNDMPHNAHGGHKLSLSCSVKFARDSC